MGEIRKTLPGLNSVSEEKKPKLEELQLLKKVNLELSKTKDNIISKANKEFSQMRNTMNSLVSMKIHQNNEQLIPKLFESLPEELQDIVIVKQLEKAKIEFKEELIKEKELILSEANELKISIPKIAQDEIGTAVNLINNRIDKLKGGSTVVDNSEELKELQETTQELNAENASLRETIKELIDIITTDHESSDTRDEQLLELQEKL